VQEEWRRGFDGDDPLLPRAPANRPGLRCPAGFFCLAFSLNYRVDHRSDAVDTTRRKNGGTVAEHGVFHREGNTLTLSVSEEGKPRPASPDATENGAMRWVFRKVG